VAGFRPAFFVVKRAAWLAPPSQDGPLDHVFLGGATAWVRASLSVVSVSSVDDRLPDP
jgi:hypothetical protein